MPEMPSRRAALTHVQANSSTNAGLWLERYPQSFGAKGGNASTIETVTNTVKISAEYRLHYDRWQKALEKQNARTKLLEVDGRMIVGLGAESILETSITLHRIYGVPMIPGSALKGLASASAHRFLVDSAWRKKTKQNEQGPSHEILFGNTKAAGFVTFHDALFVPEQKDAIPLDLDVMTVHHREYYGGHDAPPADWDAPNPVSFVTARGTYLVALEGPEEWTRVAMDILVEALREDGIGAKTAAGYGRLRVPKAETERLEREANARQARLAAIESKKRDLSMGNAAHRVPEILAAVAEADRAEVAKSLITKLTRKSLKAKLEKEWVRRLYAAAGEPLK